MTSDTVDIVLRLFVITVSLTFHEAAHAWTAFRLGDSTAADEGRLTLNPLAHFDIMGTLMIIFAPIGWAKPVPVNPRNFKNPGRDMSLVALAGPASNIVLALIACTAYAILRHGAMDLGWFRLLSTFITMNFGLAIFNLLPVFPLDGSKALSLVLPNRTAQKWEMASDRFGMYPLIIIIVWGNFIGGGPLSWWFALWRPIVAPIAQLFGVYNIL
jgi:Zn-dependent protease